MECKIITSLDELYELEEPWERLQETDADATIYSTFRFAKAWCEAHRDDKNKEIFVIYIYQGRDALGIAPFAIEHHSKWGLNYRELFFLGMGDFFTVLVDHTKEDPMAIYRKIFNCVVENSDKWEKISLTNMVNDSKLCLFFLRNSKYNSSLGYSRFNIECPKIDFDRFESFEQYKDYFKSKSMKGIIRDTRRLKEATDYEIEVCKDEDVYEAMASLHISEQEYLKSKKNRLERHSLFTDERRSEFVKNIYKGKSNLITIFIKSRKHDNRLIAYLGCYKYKDVLHSWNMAYDPEFEKFSVGSIVFLELIRHCFENNLAAKLDLGCGRYPWKFDFTDKFTALYQLEFWNDESDKARRIKRLSEIKSGINSILGRNY